MTIESMTPNHQLINDYFKTLNTQDDSQRNALIKQTWHVDGTFVSPMGLTESHQSNSDLISSFHQNYPGTTIQQRGEVHILNEKYLKFGFEAIASDGTCVFSGTDFATLDQNKLTLVAGFFDTNNPTDKPASSESTIDIAHNIYQAFNAGDFDRWASYFANEFEWHAADNSPIADHSPYYGLNTVLQEVFPRLGQLYPGMKLRTDEIFGTKDKAIMLGYYYNLPTHDGRRTEAQVSHILTFRNGKVVKFQQYLDSLKFSQL